MVAQKQKVDTINRLNRIEGQVRGVIKMIEEGRYCIDVLAQTRSIAAALRKVDEQILENHLKSCVTNAFSSGNAENQRKKIGEIIEVISNFGGKR